MQFYKLIITVNEIQFFFDCVFKTLIENLHICLGLRKTWHNALCKMTKLQKIQKFLNMDGWMDGSIAFKIK